MTGAGAAPVRPLKHAPERVMVLQLKRLGDLVLATPAIEALRTAWPASHLTLVTEAPFHEILAGSVTCDRVELHPRGGVASLKFGGRLARARPDLLLDFQGSATSARLALQSRAHRRVGWDRRVRRLAYTDVVPGSPPAAARFTGDQKLDFLRILGLAPGPAVPRLHVPPAARSEGRKLLDEAGIPPDGTYCVMVPASRRIYKRWSPDSWARVQAGMRAAGIGPVLLAGGPGESEEVDAVRQACRPYGSLPAELKVESLAGWLGLLEGARLVVGLDGGVRQVAQALGRPTFGLFGPQNPAHWLCPLPVGRHRGLAGRRPGCTVRCSAGSIPCACLAALPWERVLAEILSGTARQERAARLE